MAKNMKITYFSYIWDIDGISVGAKNKAYEFIGALERLGYRIFINWQTRQPSQVENKNIKMHIREVLKRYLQRFLKEPKKLLSNITQFISEYQIIQKQKPNIIFERLDLYLFAAALLAKMKRIPLVIEVDCPPYYEYKTSYGKRNLHIPFVPEYLERLNLRWADAAFVISSELKRYYVTKGVPDKKMIVIPNGADPKRFYPQPRDKSLEKLFGLEGKIVIGWVGSGWSGIEKLVDMVQQIVHKREDVSFFFVCGGECKAFFKEKFRNLVSSQRVVLPGKIPSNEINRYLSCMNITLAPYPGLDFAYPSSLKVFEYMAAGKAVLASRIGQIAEIIEEERNGCLFDPDSHDEMIEKILMLIQNPKLRKSMGRQAREDVLKYYTWDRNALTMSQAFHNVLKQYGTRANIG
jgi:glycosyltransferase involved in cell wall biosynthesis